MIPLPGGGWQRGTRPPGLLAHLVFAVTLVALAVLGAWWTIFMSRAVELERESRAAALQHEAALAALALGHGATPPALGPLPGSADLELISAGERQPGDLSVLAEPSHPNLAVRPPGERIEALDHKLKRRRLMVAGEGGLLFLLLGVCTVMLYHLVWAERRHQGEMEDFVSAVTHEMKTPIAGIRSLLETLAAGRVPEDRARRLVGLGLEVTDRLDHMVENVLLAGRIRTRRHHLELRPTPLRLHLESFLEHRNQVLGDHHGRVRLLWEPPSPGLQVLADPDALRIVLENLVDNGLKYGGADPTVTLRVRQEGRRVEVSVEDQGVGFPPDEAEALFQPYRRGKGGKVVHGTGIGLSLARHLVTQMGGRLNGRSRGRGEGATFVFTLPAQATDPRRAEEEVS